jgi:hypothetical protein
LPSGLRVLDTRHAQQVGRKNGGDNATLPNSAPPTSGCLLSFFRLPEVLIKLVVAVFGIRKETLPRVRGSCTSGDNEGGGGWCLERTMLRLFADMIPMVYPGAEQVL